MSTPTNLRDRLSTLLRYFFVKAPSRGETEQMVQAESAKMRRALGRLDDELVHLDKIVRPHSSREAPR
jgi:hypothetical protein